MGTVASFLEARNYSRRKRGRRLFFSAEDKFIIGAIKHSVRGNTSKDPNEK